MPSERVIFVKDNMNRHGVALQHHRIDLKRKDVCLIGVVELNSETCFVALNIEITVDFRCLKVKFNPELLISQGKFLAPENLL